MAEYRVTVPDNLVGRVKNSAGIIWPATKDMNEQDAIQRAICELIINLVESTESKTLDDEFAERLAIATNALEIERQERLDAIRNELGVMS